MNIYISGISGTGMGPLALMAKAAGMNVFGSDLLRGAIYDELVEAGIEVKIGAQDGNFLREKLNDSVDWFVYTSALPDDHTELVLAKESGVKCTKRDDFTAFLVEKLGLKMVAVAGTHGKTTTTAMLIWASLKLGLPASYIVGTTLGFAVSGSYKPGDQYFIYEADEYDRNFLKYHPWLAVIPAVSYDHPDIYLTREDYTDAFKQFKSQSEKVIDNVGNGAEFNLAGEVRRKDAEFAAEAILEMAPEVSREKVVEILNEFPGVGRRFEKIADGVYSDYAHHPEEISATIDVANDEKKLRGYKGIVVLYQPHQNTRQYEIQNDYADVFLGADKIYWLPTYLVREESSNLPVLTPDDLIAGLENKDVAEPAELDEKLADNLHNWLADGYMIVLMTAGPADEWLRKNFAR